MCVCLRNSNTAPLRMRWVEDEQLRHCSSSICLDRFHVRWPSHSTMVVWFSHQVHTKFGERWVSSKFILEYLYYHCSLWLAFSLLIVRPVRIDSSLDGSVSLSSQIHLWRFLDSTYHRGHINSNHSSTDLIPGPSRKDSTIDVGRRFPSTL